MRNPTVSHINQLFFPKVQQQLSAKQTWWQQGRPIWGRSQTRQARYFWIFSNLQLGGTSPNQHSLQRLPTSRWKFTTNMLELKAWYKNLNWIKLLTLIDLYKKIVPALYELLKLFPDYKSHRYNNTPLFHYFLPWTFFFNFFTSIKLKKVFNLKRIKKCTN